MTSNHFDADCIRILRCQDPFWRRAVCRIFLREPAKECTLVVLRETPLPYSAEAATPSPLPFLSSRNLQK